MAEPVLGSLGGLSDVGRPFLGGGTGARDPLQVLLEVPPGGGGFLDGIPVGKRVFHHERLPGAGSDDIGLKNSGCAPSFDVTEGPPLSTAGAEGGYGTVTWRPGGDQNGDAGEAL